MAASAFLQRPSLANVFAALLLALCMALPFSSGPIPLILLFHSQLLLLSIVGGVYYFKNPLHFKKHQPVWHKVLLVTLLSFLVSWGLVFINNTSALHYFLSSQRIVHDFLTVVLIFSAAALHKQGQLPLKPCLYGLAVSMLVMMAVQYYSYLQGVDGFVWFRTPPLAPHMRDLGNLACVMIVSLSVFWLSNKPKSLFENSFLLANIFANWAFLIWTGGRTGIVASFMCSLILMALFKWQQKTPWWRLASIIVVMFLALQVGNQLSVFSWNGVGRTLSFQSEAVATLSTPKSETTSLVKSANKITTGRAVMWQISIEAALEQPWFGLGPYGYFFIEKRDFDDQPHNFVVQFLVQWGFVGTLLLLCLLAGCAYQVLRFAPKACHKNDEHYIIASAIVLVLSLHGLTGGTYFKIQPFFALALGFSILLAFACQGKDSNS